MRHVRRSQPGAIYDGTTPVYSTFSRVKTKYRLLQHYGPLQLLCDAYPIPKTTLSLRFYCTQVTRGYSVLINIMRDVSSRDTQAEWHTQLLLCMLKPFFEMYDLRYVYLV